MSEHIPPLDGQLYSKVEKFGGAYDDGGAITTDIEKANLITSMVADRVTHHKVVVDIDMPAVLVPSSTAGHFHLYIDHEIEAEVYWELLRAMAKAGLIEENYAEACINQGRSAVRLPWIKKETK